MNYPSKINVGVTTTPDQMEQIGRHCHVIVYVSQLNKLVVSVLWMYPALILSTERHLLKKGKVKKQEERQPILNQSKQERGDNTKERGEADSAGILTQVWRMKCYHLVHVPFMLSKHLDYPRGHAHWEASDQHFTKWKTFSCSLNTETVNPNK